MGTSSGPIPSMACGKSGHLTVLSRAANSRISNIGMAAALTLSGASASIRPLDMTTSRLFA